MTHPSQMPEPRTEAGKAWARRHALHNHEQYGCPYETPIGRVIRDVRAALRDETPTHSGSDREWAEIVDTWRVRALEAEAAREQAATEALDKYAETTGIGERGIALIDALRAHGLRPGDGDRLVLLALSGAATEVRRELLAKVWREFGADAHTIARIERLLEEPR